MDKKNLLQSCLIRVLRNSFTPQFGHEPIIAGFRGSPWSEVVITFLGFLISTYLLHLAQKAWGKNLAYFSFAYRVNNYVEAG